MSVLIRLANDTSVADQDRTLKVASRRWGSAVPFACPSAWQLTLTHAAERSRDDRSRRLVSSQLAG
jgi:hypothetical protein